MDAKFEKFEIFVITLSKILKHSENVLGTEPIQRRRRGMRTSESVCSCVVNDGWRPIDPWTSDKLSRITSEMEHG